MIESIKNLYEKEGFKVLGVVGSYARGDFTEDSDIDIVYETTQEFEKKYIGWNYFLKLNSIKKDFETILGKDVDLINKSSMSEVAKKYMMKDFVSV
jgi:predicted nucleotidyltransferase